MHALLPSLQYIQGPVFPAGFNNSELLKAYDRALITLQQAGKLGQSVVVWLMSAERNEQVPTSFTALRALCIIRSWCREC